MVLKKIYWDLSEKAAKARLILVRYSWFAVFASSLLFWLLVALWKKMA
jgi:hypothetical protein